MHKVAIAGLATIAIGIAFVIYAGTIYSEINQGLAETNRIMSEQCALQSNLPPGATCVVSADTLPKVPYPPPDDKLEIGTALILAGTTAATTSYWFKRFVSFLRYLYSPRRILIGGIIVLAIDLGMFIFASEARWCAGAAQGPGEIPCSQLDGLIMVLHELLPVIGVLTLWIGPVMIIIAVARGWRPLHMSGKPS